MYVLVQFSCSVLSSVAVGWTCVRLMESQTNRDWLEQFIDLYCSEPCLWNTKDKEYHNRDLKRSAYTKLIEKLLYRFSVLCDPRLEMK